MLIITIKPGKKTSFMKSIIQLCAFLICLGIPAQETEKPTVFKYQITEEKRAIVGTKSVMNESVYIENTLTAQENYDKVYAYIASKYEFPEDALVSSEEPSLLVIQETAPGLYTTVSLGYASLFDMRYNLGFEISDQQIKCTVSEMQIGNTTSMRSSGVEWNQIDGLYLHKRNGKPKKSMKGITDVKIENYFNRMIANVKAF